MKSLKQAALIFALLLFALLINYDLICLSVALPSLQNNLQIPLDYAQWILISYGLGRAACIIPASSFTNQLGIKYTINIGIILFLFASIIISVSYNIWIIVFSRILQGLAAALFVPSLYSTIKSQFSTEKQANVFAIIFGSSGLILAFSPFITGYLLSLGSWRIIFIINIPICILCFLFTTYLIQSKKKYERNFPCTQFNLSQFLIPPIIFLILINISQIENKTIISLLLLVGLIAAFILFEKSSKPPLFKKSILSNSFFKKGLFMYSSVQITYGLIIISLTIYLQEAIKLSSKQTGELFLLMTIPQGIGLLLSGKLLEFFNKKEITNLLFLILCAIVATIVYILLHKLTYVLYIFLPLFGLTIGAIMPLLRTIPVDELTDTDLPLGTAIYTLCGLISIAIGISLATNFCLTQFSFN